MKVITTSIISILITILTFTGNAQNTEIAYSQNLDIYRIVAVENQNEQIVSISNTVTVEKPLTLYAPNAFSPDGGGRIDEVDHDTCRGV